MLKCGQIVLALTYDKMSGLWRRWRGLVLPVSQQEVFCTVPSIFEYRAASTAYQALAGVSIRSSKVRTIELDAANAFPYDSDATVEPDSEEEVQDQAEEIREFFTNNPRFRFKKIIAHGSYGATFQAQLVDPKIPKIKDFIVKRAFDDEYARDQMSTEKRILGVCTLTFVNDHTEANTY